MTDMVVQKNIGSLITVRGGSSSLAVTAGGGGNNTTKNGNSIDREGLTGGGGSLPESALASVLYEATLASGSTLAIQIILSHSVDNSTFTTYTSSSSTSIVVATGPSGGGAVVGQTNLAINLSSANRYVRLDHVPNLSRAGTDTSITKTVIALAGFDRLASPT